jgi:uncharacterized RDD family membrane protein YckC
MVGQLNGQWHPDPTGRHQLRWWDGQAWTDFVADGGVTAVDPVAGSPAPGQGAGAAQMTSATPMSSIPPAYATAPVQYRPYATAPVVGDERVPAGIPLTNPWARLASTLIDLVLFLVTLAIGWLIWTLIVWAKGQTPGKQICGQRVVMKRTGRAATWGEMALRDFVIRGLAIGIISQITCGIFALVATFMIFSTYHETMWDKWAGTLVVDDREGRTLDLA